MYLFVLCCNFDEIHSEENKLPETKYLSANTVAKRYDVTRNTILVWVRDGKLPAPVKINGATRWKESDLIEWEAKR